MKNRIISKKTNNFILLYFVTTLLTTIVIGMSLFDIKLIESIDSRLIATSNYNYAISSPKLLAKNWRSVSVNGDNILIITSAGEKIFKSKLELPEPDRLFLETLREEIANSNFGYTHTSMSGGGLGGSSMSSMSSDGMGSSSSFSSSGGFASSSMGGMMQGNDMSVSMKDIDNFSVSKSSFPFRWARVFVNGDIVAVVCKDGQVLMNTMNTLEPAQLEVIKALKNELRDFHMNQSNQVASTMQNSLGMISNIFNNIMGSLPSPPSFGSAVGNTFGNNFPFGPNNSPFSASAGWPFASSGGSFAFASARR